MKQCWTYLSKYPKNCLGIWNWFWKYKFSKPIAKTISVKFSLFAFPIFKDNQTGWNFCLSLPFYAYRGIKAGTICVVFCPSTHCSHPLSQLQRNQKCCANSDGRVPATQSRRAKKRKKNAVAFFKSDDVLLRKLGGYHESKIYTEEDHLNWKSFKLYWFN